MDVKLGGTGFARQLSKALCQLFLKVIVEAVLGAEENDATLGDFMKVSMSPGTCESNELELTGDRQIS